MAATGPHGLPLPIPSGSMGTDQHIETEKRTEWNEDTHSYETREFVYEVSWVPELAAWRRFLRARRKA